MQTLRNTPNINDLKASRPECKAILWDMDGTIMETEELHIQATILIIKEQSPTPSITREEIVEICTGNTDKMIYEFLSLKNIKLAESLEQFIYKKNNVLAELIKSTSLNSIFKPEISQFMSQVQNAGIEQAVVTSSEKDVTQNLLNHLGLTKYFKFILTREDTTENKPSPMPYNKAISMLNLNDDDVVIFEDSETGLQAANATKASVYKAMWYTK